MDILSPYYPAYLWLTGFLANVLLLLLSLFVGQFFLNLFSSHTILKGYFTRVFVSSMLGWVAVFTLYALYKSSGSTVFVSLLIPLSFLCYQGRSSFTLNVPSFRWETPVLWLVLILVLLFTIQYVQVIRFDSTYPFYIQNWDYKYYSNFVDVLQHTGIENAHGPATFYEAQSKGTTPYHFSELWTSALWSEATGHRPILALRLGTYVFFQLLMYVGVLAIWERYQVLHFKEYFFAFFLLFVGGVYFSFYDFVPFVKTVNYLSDNHLMGYGNVKYGVLILMTILALLLYTQGHRWEAYCVWFSLPVFSISILPAVLSGALLLALFQIKSRARIERKYWLFSLLLLFVLFLFYVLTGASDNSSVTSNAELLLSYAWGLPLSEALILGFKKALVCFVLFPAKFLISVLPWLLVIYSSIHFGKLKELLAKNIALGVLLLGTLLGGLFSFWLWYLNYDAQQLFINVAYPLSIVFIISVLVSNAKKFSKTVIFLIVLLITYAVMRDLALISVETRKYNQKYSQEYLIQVKQAMEEYPDAGGGFFAGADYYDKNNLATYKPTLHIEGYYLPLLRVHTPFSLSVFDSLPVLSAESMVAVRRFQTSSYFYRYCKSTAPDKRGEDLTLSMLNFIQMNKLRYLVIGREAKVPKEVLERCETCIVDTKSGERFCILKDH